jgi:hypothetical protein
MPWFKRLTYASLQQAWQKRWSFILDHPDAPYAAPILLGEFGTCNLGPGCVEGQAPDSQGSWFQLVLRFVREHPALGWSFFALDGTNANNCLTDNGLLNAGWDNLSSLALQRGLRSIQPSPGLLPTTTAVPLLPGTATQRAPRSPNSPLCRLP